MLRSRFGEAELSTYPPHVRFSKSVCTVINIAEGTGKFSKADKRNFYFIARGSVYECVALFEMIQDQYHLEQSLFDQFYRKFESISKMLFGLINSQRVAT